MPRLDKVIVVGLDGLEPTVAEPLLARGELPNLARLAQSGGFARVRTTCPAQTPVAWSTFATGVNPGGHGIFDFVRRDPDTYLPDLALNRYEQKNAFLPPKAVNLRRGRTVWEELSDAGIPSTVVRCPCTYPPERIRGRVLSGMGVPDLRGGLGTPTLYTTDRSATAGESERVVHLDAGDVVETELVGPRDTRRGGDVILPLTLAVDRAGRRVTVRSAGEPRELEVREGAWSDWLRVKFPLGMLRSVHGMVRFHLVRAEPELELYASPVNFDPATPMFPISEPWEYAGELARTLGPFYTTGMVEDHGGLSNGRFDDAAYLEQCRLAMDEREAMMRFELERFDRGLFFCLFDTPDRVQHMFWRAREAGDADAAEAIHDQYRRGDAMVGHALERADDRTLVVALSDHGFNSFRRGVHLNSWLRENGYLALKPGAEPGDGGDDMLRSVDWGRTRAFAMGLGSIYLNVRGREAEGTVDPAGADAVGAEIAERLTGLPDPETGETAVRGVARRDQAYRGPYAAESPDLVAMFAPGYRVSWETATGGVPRGLVAANDKRWNGDHIIDPSLVPGVLFMNRPFRGDDPGLADLAPTILDALGAPRGAEMEGESLLPE